MFLRLDGLCLYITAHHSNKFYWNIHCLIHIEKTAS